ncbi:MAG: transcriptional regulator GcvA [Alphaproteobacteria bacterium]|nr:transcriptional regulator GcvA [Alphaproteobacteria bacterium]
MKRLPPLNAIRAFEAAARHLSFAKAAEELNVSPGAVSHHIKTLEADLGQSLFKRLNRAVVLTQAGQLCLPGIREGFDKIRVAIDKIRKTEDDSNLRVSVGPAFAAKWLLPRIYKFAELHPDIGVTVLASLSLADFEIDPVDVAIRYGQGDYPDLYTDLLFHEWHSPMCSPKLLEGEKPLKTPADLKNFTLIHDDTLKENPLAPDWEDWLNKVGVKNMDLTKGLHFTQADHSLQAAIAGHGVTLGRYLLASGDLDAGRLVMPFDFRVDWPFSYYLVSPKVTKESLKVSAFRQWILEEVVEYQVDFNR